MGIVDLRFVLQSFFTSNPEIRIFAGHLKFFGHFKSENRVFLGQTETLLATDFRDKVFLDRSFTTRIGKVHTFLISRS